LISACASSQLRPIASPFVQNPPPPIVRRCQPPPDPGRLETQADLLLAYIDALSAWKACSLEIERIIQYYEEIEK